MGYNVGETEGGGRDTVAKLHYGVFFFNTTLFFSTTRLPSTRPEPPSLRHVLHRTPSPVTPLLEHLRAPPREASHPSWIHETEENDDEAEREGGVECGRERHGVFRPPGWGAEFQRVVEDEAG